MLTNIACYIDFERALALALILSTIFFLNTKFEDMIHFGNCFRGSLSMLKLALNSFVFTAFTNWTSYARLTLDVTFVADSLVKLGSMNGWKGWKGQININDKKERKKQDYREAKLKSGMEWKGTDRIEMIENVLCARCYKVNWEADCIL